MKIKRFTSCMICLGIFILTACSNLFAQEFTPQFKPTLHVPKVTQSIKVDGKFNEAVWKQAAVADNFAETNPGDQTKPSVESKALIMYDDQNLYVALIAYDDPSTVRTSYSDRDNIFRDDYFGLMLDTYGDQTWGYEFFVNPYGIQGDLRTTTNSGEDESFDVVWESIGIVTDSGYQVEIAIPFASLRFPDKEVQTWRANFWRDHQRDLRRRYAWAATDRDLGCFLCNWGYLTGIENIKSGKNIEIIPNLVTTRYGERMEFQDPSSSFDYDDPEAEVSLNARYGLTSNSSLELAVNPDFSQVESDQAQIDINSTFGLFYPERRPFFQEGSEMFDTWISAIYTRSINDPSVSTKFTGQFGRLGMAYLFAIDETSPILVPLRQQSRFALAENSTVNIFRARQTFGQDSHIGFTFTDRRYDDFGDNEMHKGGSGTTFGFDSNLRLSKSWRIESQILLSHTKEITDAHIPVDTTIETTIYGDTLSPDSTVVDTTIDIPAIITSPYQDYFDNGRYTVDLDGESYWGDATYISLERNGRRWNFDMDYYGISPTFRTDDGFNTRNDYRSISVWTGLWNRPNKKWITNWEPSISFGRNWKYDAKVDITKYDRGAFDEWFRAEVYLETRMQTEISMNYLNSQENFFGENFPGISRINFYMNSRFSEMAGIGISLNTGTSIWRNRDNPDLGYNTNYEVWGTFKPTERLIVTPSYYRSVMDRRDSYFEDPNHAGEPQKIFDASVFYTKFTYQFGRNVHLRLVVQYVNSDSYSFDEVEQVNGSDTTYVKKHVVENFKNILIEPLLTYKINAFTKFYIGMSSNYDYVYPDNNPIMSERINHLTDPEYSLSNRQFFAKFQYLFRM